MGRNHNNSPDFLVWKWTAAQPQSYAKQEADGAPQEEAPRSRVRKADRQGTCYPRYGSLIGVQRQARVAYSSSGSGGRATVLRTNGRLAAMMIMND